MPEHTYPAPLQERTLRAALGRLWAYRALLRLWLRYRIEARYRQLVLGVLWIVLLPLSTALVLAFAFTQLLGDNALDVPYVAFLLSGQVIFGVFQSIILNAKGGLVDHLDMMKQVAFPREIPLLLNAGEALVDFIFTFLAMLLIHAAFFGLAPNVHFIWLPLVLLGMLALALGLAFVLADLGVRVRDLQNLLAVLVQLLFFMIVLYLPGSGAQQYDQLMMLNPLAQFVVAFRAITIYGHAPDPLGLGLSLLLALLLLIWGYRRFKRREDALLDWA